MPAPVREPVRVRLRGMHLSAKLLALPGFHSYSFALGNLAARRRNHKDLAIMTEYRDYLEFMYSVLEKHNKDGAPLSETTELVVDIGLSSLQVMDFVVKIEDQFDISIPLNVLPDVYTLGDFARKLQELDS
jgi:acyl carrier protein